MNTIKIDSKNTLMIAHRGVSALETENTAPAFVACGNRSYYGAECDIRSTKDGEFILCHDKTFLRTSGVDVAPGDLTLDELRQLVLFDIGGVNKRTDIRPTTLAEYVSICKKYGKKCIIELKECFTEQQVLSYIDVIKKQEYLDSCIFIAFDYENLEVIRKFLPDQPVQFLTDDLPDELFERMVKDRFDLDIYYRSLTKELLDRCHASGIKVNCWTVDNPEDAERLCDWGVDFITSNILEGK